MAIVSTLAGQWALVVGFTGTVYWLVWSLQILPAEQRKDRNIKNKFIATIIIMGIATLLSLLALFPSG